MLEHKVFRNCSPSTIKNQSFKKRQEESCRFFYRGRRPYFRNYIYDAYHYKLSGDITNES